MRNTFVSAALLSAVALSPLVSARAIDKRDIIWENAVNQASNGNLIFDKSPAAATLAVVNREVSFDGTTTAKKTRSGRPSRTAYTAAPAPTGAGGTAPSAPGAPAGNPQPHPSSAAPPSAPSSAIPPADPQPYPSSAESQPAASSPPPPPPAANPSITGQGSTATLGAPQSGITWNAVKERQDDGVDQTLGGTDSSTTFEGSDTSGNDTPSSTTIEARDLPWWMTPKQPKKPSSAGSAPTAAKPTGAAQPTVAAQPSAYIPKYDPNPEAEPGSISINQDSPGVITTNTPDGSFSMSPAGSSITFYPSSGDKPTTVSTGLGASPGSPFGSGNIGTREEDKTKPKPQPQTQPIVISNPSPGTTQTLGISSSGISFTPAFGSSSGSDSSTIWNKERDDIVSGSQPNVDEELNLQSSTITIYPADGTNAQTSQNEISKRDNIVTSSQPGLVQSLGISSTSTTFFPANVPKDGKQGRSFVA